MEKRAAREQTDKQTKKYRFVFFSFLFNFFYIVFSQQIFLLVEKKKESNFFMFE